MNLFPGSIHPGQMALGPAGDQGEGKAGQAQLCSRGLSAPRPRPPTVRDGAEAGGTGHGLRAGASHLYPRQ